ncbi:mesoderm induction early response protein 1 isoform X2 [Centruroides vittatus]|uniref:mesoderm induction early response protein 1 isoform X2 n=1 Tax=Centruroides vittatus TaxID=120091 RepID=UPI00350F2A37
MENKVMYSDQDFDPTAEMLVNDFDDEHTLEEEEALESAESVTNELDDLQREGEMPLDELLAMYGYDGRDGANSPVKQLSSNTESPIQPDMISDKEESVDVSLSHCSDREESPVEIPENPSGPLLRSVSQASESSDSGTDDDYSPDEDWRKTIQVGSDYQAMVPEGLCKYDDAPAYENEDRLLWDPSKLTDQEVVEYLRQAQQPFSSCAQGVNAIPVGSHIRDDEQALYLLLQCGHNVEEALRRRRMQPLPPADTMSLWSEEECRSFENGLRTYGKDFHMIQHNKVRTRSVGELVQFYYLWKKTERHDVFASKNRLEKKKYALHPGTTDYMDRFLDEQENPSTHRDRSSSPSMHSLMFGDSKKQQCVRSSTSSPTVNHSKLDTFTDINSQGESLHPTEAVPFISDIGYSLIDRDARMRSIDGRNYPESRETVQDSSREFVNGASNTMDNDKTHDLQNIHHVESLTNVDKNSSCNPPTDIVNCTHHPTEVSRYRESRSDNQRFESLREEVASME